jgi:hypothetical protein
MIQTKQQITYGDRDEKQGVILIEVRPLEMTKEGQKYLVIDWDISKEPKEAWKSKEVFYDNDKINQVDAYLESTNDFSEMTKIEKEWRKIQLGLMLDTQTNLLVSGKTIYGINTNDWVFSIENIETVE